MDTFEEKIKKSFGDLIISDSLNNEIIDFMVDKVVNAAIDYDRGAAIDFDDQAKKLTNSLIDKANNIKSL